MFNEEGYNTHPCQKSWKTQSGLFQQVLDSMVDVQYFRDENEEYVCTGFSEEHLGIARVGMEISIAARYLSNIINCGIVAPTARRKQTGRELQKSRYNCLPGTY